jgi:predicted metal-dependent hydrolase
MTKKYRASIHADGLELPVDITLERRKDTRFGITGKRVTLRVPTSAPPDFIRQKLSELQDWVVQVFSQKPILRAPFVGKTYQTGDCLRVGKRQYFLDIQTETRETHTGKLIGDTIQLQLSTRSTALNREKAIKTLLSRIVAGDFRAEIRRRVLDMNDRTFRRPIQSINLKYNHSNWCSCSSNHNLNLSTRLLFAPDDVQDYVILHELAHLVELNHSDRFWALVARYMPDYQDKEQWLKANRAKCDF